MNNQMNNAVRKIHNLHSSGAVTVTGLSQPRILKQKTGSTVVATGNTHSMQPQQTLANSTNRCYVCDDALGANQQQNLLTETQTLHTSTKFPNKIGQLVGDAFMVIVSVEDVVCARCTNLLNYLDRLENDVERVRTNLMNLLHKKYGLNDEGGGGAASPPIKMQKMNSGSGARTAEETNTDLNRVRKVLHTTISNESALAKQSPSVSAVQQMKISTPATVPQNSAGTQTFQRKTTKIYKCLSCDYKTSDMRLFNTHYETCKQQNFQCKNCKKIFPNFGTMKQHMVREHNTTMDNTCAVCHINFVNEQALRKHMEANHSTNVVVTSTTTLPGPPAVDSITSGATTPLYTCNHCQFKSTDKALFDEHFRKHLSGVKPKPFKCRLCAQRFETREAATVHAKQHQPNYFKCGTCSMSFPKRELLVKHFEVHQPNNQAVQQQQQVIMQTQTTPNVKPITSKQQTTSQNILTTQKLLQETIDEALSDNVNTVAGGGAEVGSTAANNIRFFSCHICSLTFIQENYYNQHMEAHRRDKEGDVGNTTSSGTTVTTSASATPNNTMLHPSAAALLSEGTKGDNEVSGVSSQQSGGGSVTSISEADIESIFEKMHSDKSDTGASTSDAVAATSSANTGTTNTTSIGGTAQNSGENLVITSQRGSGGITFNITIPQPDAGNEEETKESNKSKPTSNTPVSVSIDMPVLDQSDEGATIISGGKGNVNTAKADNESGNENETAKAPVVAPVSMPSLDDENDGQEQTQTQSSVDEANLEKNKTTDEKPEEGSNKGDKTKEENTHKGDVNTADMETNASGEASEANSGHSDQAVSSGDVESGASAEQINPATASGDHHQVAMELDEAMQAQVESGQIKFILNENGQLLQLDNHIITDAEGNQILVQDPEQIQQLLQSAGLLQSGDGLDGETLQMMTDANGQMVLVQGENNETQLIDASLLNADGQLVIQQGHDGDLGEGAHVIGEDGTRIPVSVSYTADGQPIVRVQQQVLDSAEENGQHIVLDKESASAVRTEEGTAQGASEGETNVAASSGDANAAAGGSSGGDFFPLEDLMQQSSENKEGE